MIKLHRLTENGSAPEVLVNYIHIRLLEKVGNNNAAIMFHDSWQLEVTESVEDVMKLLARFGMRLHDDD